MKFMLYQGWEIYLYRIDMGGIACYFAAAPEVVECKMSVESFWHAFETLRYQLDAITSNQSLDDSELPF